MKLFQKYSVLLASNLVLAVGAVTGLALQQHRRALTREALLRAESIAVNLAMVSAEAILTRNVLQLLPLSMDATTRHEGVVYAAVVDRQGLVLAHPDRAAIHHPLDFQAARMEGGYGIQAQVADGTGMGQKVWDVRVPVRAKGSLVDLGWVHVGLDQRTVQASVKASMRQQLLVGLACLALGLVVAMAAIGYLVKPLQHLAQAAVSVGQGDLTVAVPDGGKDELGELARRFNRMVEDLRVAEGRRLVALRLETELRVAHAIQTELLPAHEPALPGWETAFFYEPAKELGGDYYDWFPVAGGRIGFIVADVSGKGVPAALHMANLRNVFRFTTRSEASPSEVLKQVNALFFADMKGESFVTLIYGVLDPASSSFNYVSAGHDPVLWFSAADQKVRQLDGASFPVGIVSAAEFDPQVTERSIQMGKGDLILLYTDGVTEARDGKGEQYGLERIGRILPGLGAPAALAALKQDLKGYLNGREAEDDVTAMALRRNA